MVTSATVENGTVVLLNGRGLSGQRIGNQYAAAGVCGNDLICVTKHGEVQHFIIENDHASYVKFLGKSHDPLAVQVGSNLNFSVIRSNGQTDFYQNGGKVRTTGEANVDRQFDSDHIEPDNHEYSSGSYGGGCSFSTSSSRSNDDPDITPMSCVLAITFMVGMALFFIVTAYVSFEFGLLAAAVTACIGYFLRHAWARCFRRALYGLPVSFILLIVHVRHSEWAIVEYAMLATLIWWFWPLVCFWDWFRSDDE